MIPFQTLENVAHPETSTIGVNTKYEGTWWFPYFLPTNSVVHQHILPKLIYAVDPPADLPVTPIQLYKKVLCVEFLIHGKCSQPSCQREHLPIDALWKELGLYKRRENTIGSIPESVDELERRPDPVPRSKIEDWVAKQQFFGVCIFSKNHPVYWIRNFKSIDIGRIEFWDELEYVHTENKRVAIIQKPLLVDLRQVQAIKIFSKPLCLFYFQNQKCDRTNCNFLHRTEEEIARLIAKRYYEIKDFPKKERFKEIVHIDGVGQTSQFTSAEIIQYQLEERELKKLEKEMKDAREHRPVVIEKKVEEKRDKSVSHPRERTSPSRDESRQRRRDSDDSVEDTKREMSERPREKRDTSASRSRERSSSYRDESRRRRRYDSYDSEEDRRDRRRHTSYDSEEDRRDRRRYDDRYERSRRHDERDRYRDDRDRDRHRDSSRRRSDTEDSDRHSNARSDRSYRRY